MAHPFPWPDTVEVFGQQVPLPGRAERGNDAWTLASVLAENTEEHEASCHGPACDGTCAERAYARWSGLLEPEPAA